MSSYVAVYWRPIFDATRVPWIPWRTPWINDTSNRVTARHVGILIPELGMDIEVPLEVPLEAPRSESMRVTSIKWETHDRVS